MKKNLGFIIYISTMIICGILFSLLLNTSIKFVKNLRDNVTQSSIKLNEVYKYQKNITEFEFERPTYKYLKSVSAYIVQKIKKGDKDGVSVGSGTIITIKDGYYYILTNKHVCSKDTAKNCFLKDDNDYLVPLEYVNQDENVDLALFRTRYFLPTKRAVLGFSSVYIGDKVFSVGQYLGIDYTYTEGTLSNYFGEKDIYNLPCAFGCSGSGVFDRHGNLVSVIYAVNSLQVTNGFGNYAVTSKAIAINIYNIKNFLNKSIE